MKPRSIFSISAIALAAMSSTSRAGTLEGESWTGSFDSVISAGTGVRTKRPDPSLILAGNQTGPSGTLSPFTGYGDQGDLNYQRGSPFTTYLKGSHELLLNRPEDKLKLMARVNWVRDFAATRTSGDLSAASAGLPLEDGFASRARKDVEFKARLLDLWVSKSFALGDNDVRIRAGNQVISWGESLFMPGGINTINALDLQRLSQPGTQIKEAVLPAPMVSAAIGLGSAFNLEAYVQTRWNANYFPPVGSYWSTSHSLGVGSSAYGASTKKPKQTGQWGASLRYQPEGMPVNLGAYFISYTDKNPSFSLAQNAFVYAEDRKLIGVSANTQVGDWALGTELSYRPRESVAITGSCNGGGNCWIDTKRIQWHGTAILGVTRDNAGWLLDVLKANGANLIFEAVAISYPSLHKTYNDGQDLIQAGAWGWGFEPGGQGTPTAVGSKNAYAITANFSWTYDGTLLPGWQVTPEVVYQHSLKGRSPNGLIMQGARSANFSVTFVQNPANWQFGVNYAKYWGGSSIYDQPYRDRDYVGAYASRSF